VPPNLVLNGIALILSLFIMAPVGMSIRDALQARHFDAAGQLSTADIGVLADAALPPIKDFLVSHTRQRDREFFVRTATSVWPKNRADGIKDDDLLVLVPSFTLAELTKAFQIGFVIYIVFIVVDLLVANILLALGMQMISPTTISVPFKLLLFVALDGWSLLVHGLVLSYRVAGRDERARAALRRRGPVRAGRADARVLGPERARRARGRQRRGLHATCARARRTSIPIRSPRWCGPNPASIRMRSAWSAAI
jgi:type III secretion protein R